MNEDEFKLDGKLEITIDWRWSAYALLIKHSGTGVVGGSSLTFYDTVTEAKNAISTILLEFNI